MSIIKITGSGAYEHTQETNHSLEYLKRTLTEHKLKPTLDHPDGSVTEEKLSAEVRDRMTKHESDIQEFNEKKADKSELDTKADKATVYTKSETDTIFSTKADKATTYTIAQTDTILSTKADKSYTYTKAEVDSIADDVKEKVDDYLIPETSSLSAQLIYVGEHKADRSELPTKVSQLENDKNYVTPEEIQPIYQDINYLDTQTRNLKTTKADKATTYTATETDDMLSTKADKADLDWKLIGEEEVTEADITTAGENGVTVVTIDLGAPIEQWYNETLIRVFIPKSSDLNPTITSGKLKIYMGDTETNSVTGDLACIIVGSQNNNVLVDARYKQEYTITSNWLNKQTLTHSYIAYRGYGASSGYVVNPFQAYNSVEAKSVNSASKRRFLSLLSFYGKAVNGVEEKTMFKYPAGTKISLYGRL